MTLRQTLTLAAFFTGFAIHAQATSIIVDGELNERELHSNGNLGDWPASTLMALSRLTFDDRKEYSSAHLYLGHDAKAFNDIDAPHRYLALMTALSANIPPGLFGSRSDDHRPWNSLGEYELGARDFRHPASSKAMMRIDYLGQLFFAFNPFSHMSDHKNNDHRNIAAYMPLLVSVDFDAHRSVNHHRDEYPANPGAVEVPEPTSLALLALGLLALTVMLLKHQKPLLSHPAAEPVAQQNELRSRFSSARLLRRDLRHNVLLFKFLHQRKYTIL